MSENTDYDKACREIARIAAALGIVDYSGDTSEIFDAIIIKDEKHQALARKNAAITDIVGIQSALPDSYQPEDVAAAIYDAGYRKPKE